MNLSRLCQIILNRTRKSVVTPVSATCGFLRITWYGKLLSLHFPRCASQMQKQWNSGYTCNFFYPRWQCNFKKLLHCRLTYKFLCVACLALAVQYLLKSCRNIENLNILAMYLLVNFAIAMCSRLFPAIATRKLHCNCGWKIACVAVV